jgi:uncharacterized protein (DUF302 family)
MTSEPATTTYSVPEPFEAALKLIRAVLARAGLSVQGELDVSRRIQRSLGIGMARCKVLYVFSDQSLESINIRPEVGIILPLHIVVSARGGQTEIHLLASLPSNSDNPAPALADPVNRLQDKISRAFEKIAMLRGYCQLRT